MPRNSNGEYTLVAGNPVSAGTVIAATWANSTLNDISWELTDSLSRTGKGPMLAPLILWGSPPTYPNEAVPKSYVDGAISTLPAYGLTAIPVPIVQGGTEATTTAAALTNLTIPNHNWISIANYSGNLAARLIGSSIDGSKHWGLSVDSAPSTFAFLEGAKSGKSIWHIYLGDNTVMGSGNSGADFGIARFDSTGAYLGRPLTIYRTDGRTEVTRLDVKPSNDNAILYLQKPATGMVSRIVGNTGNNGRWSMDLGDWNAESGGNAGSDFNIIRWMDNGSTIEAMRIVRSTGKTYFQADVHVDGYQLYAGSCELGGLNQYAFIDFNSFGTKNDYDARIITAPGTGQSGVAGRGQLQVICDELNIQCNTRTRFQVGYIYCDSYLQASNLYSRDANVWMSDLVVGEYTKRVGLSGNVMTNPFITRLSDGALCWLIYCDQHNIYVHVRSAGYMYWSTDAGGVGCNYFVSDETRKNNILPSKIQALSAIDAVKMIEFDYNKDTKFEELHRPLGFSAQNLQSINPLWVSKLPEGGDDDLHPYGPGGIFPNSVELITWMFKAIQELSAKIKILEAKA